MGLPFASIPDVLAPDDVVSYQHEQRMIDRVNDASDLLAAQHDLGLSALRGTHKSGQFPVAMGMYSLQAGIDSNMDPWSEDLSVNILSKTWQKWTGNLDGSDRDYYEMVFRLDTQRIHVQWADVFVAFSGTPGPTPYSNTPAIAPYVGGSSGGDQGHDPQLVVHFGARDVDKIVQFTLLAYGWVVR